MNGNDFLERMAGVVLVIDKGVHGFPPLTIRVCGDVHASGGEVDLGSKIEVEKGFRQTLKCVVEELNLSNAESGQGYAQRIWKWFILAVAEIVALLN